MNAVRGSRVLHIEHDPVARMRLAEDLSPLGYIVSSAADGPSGIAAFSARPADIVLLDLRLPGADAISVCRRLKKLSRDDFLPVLFLTADSSVGERVCALEAGDDFCVQPMRLEELAAHIEVLLRLRKRERRLKTESNRFRLIAYVDSLTDLGNRRALEAELDHAWARSLESERPLGLLMVDIDRFKSVNDRYGHPNGDNVLRVVARTIACAVRKSDTVYRQGGDEFVIVAPDSSREGALLIGERVRDAVAKARVLPPLDSMSREPISVSVSVGFALAPSSEISGPAALIEAADRALYDAKAAGRDRVVASPSLAE